MQNRHHIKALGFDIGGVMLPYSIPQQKQFIADSIGVELEDVLRAYRKYLPLLDSSITLHQNAQKCVGVSL